ncbi:MAG: ASCH domain-containing protein [Bacilli bacterium]|nr:ASCH domain-containing protein [Bacilli bacterium]
MKVITIKQPWASLIAEGIKEYEFRTWKTKYRGDILIHAGKGIDKKAMKKFECYNLDYPSGCIIAKATLTDCILVDEESRKMLNRKNPLVYSNIINDLNWKGYGFKLENVEKVKPIDINGKLSLWNYDYKD